MHDDFDVVLVRIQQKMCEEPLEQKRVHENKKKPFF